MRNMILAVRFTKESKAKMMMGSGVFSKLKDKSIIRGTESFVPSRRMRRLKRNMKKLERRGKLGSKKQIERDRSFKCKQRSWAMILVNRISNLPSIAINFQIIRLLSLINHRQIN